MRSHILSSTRALGIAAAVAALLVSACGQSTEDAEAGIRNTLEAFYAAMKNGDRAAAMSHIAEDAVFVEGGRLETRKEYEDNHLPNDIGFEKQVTGKRGPWQITIEGDTAWAIATTDYDGIFDGAPVNFTSAQLAVLTRDAETWRIRSIHWSSRRR
jgi:ketosteroid isomerase-like protein